MTTINIKFLNFEKKINGTFWYISRCFSPVLETKTLFGSPLL